MHASIMLTWFCMYTLHRLRSSPLYSTVDRGTEGLLGCHHPLDSGREPETEDPMKKNTKKTKKAAREAKELDRLTGASVSNFPARVGFSP